MQYIVSSMQYVSGFVRCTYAPGRRSTCSKAQTPGCAIRSARMMATGEGEVAALAAMEGKMEEVEEEASVEAQEASAEEEASAEAQEASAEAQEAGESGEANPPSSCV